MRDDASFREIYLSYAGTQLQQYFRYKWSQFERSLYLFIYLFIYLIYFEDSISLHDLHHRRLTGS